MNRFAAILVLLTALSIGWVPVFAAPARLAADLATDHVSATMPAPTPVHMHHANVCTEQNEHCAQGAKALHPAVCAACIGVPAFTLLVSVADRPKTIIPRGEELPLVAQAPAPLPRPPRP